jgi:Reverse transcriptase (RNA-dependent DNA polymerase)
VLPFGLTYTPSEFQRMLDAVFFEFNREKVIIYLDDIMIAIVTLEENVQLTRAVISRLKEKGLKAKFEKFEWLKESTTYLGYKISAYSVEMEEKKMESN